MGNSISHSMSSLASSLLCSAGESSWIENVGTRSSLPHAPTDASITFTTVQANESLPKLVNILQAHQAFPALETLIPRVLASLSLPSLSTVPADSFELYQRLISLHRNTTISGSQLILSVRGEFV